MNCENKYICNAILVIKISFKIIIYYSDIITDILVTYNLYDSKSQYFTISFGILLLSTFGTPLSIASDTMKNKEYRNQKCKRLYEGCKIFSAHMTQLPFIVIAIDKIWFKQKFNMLHELTLSEALLESAPQALFQLYIVLNETENKNIDKLTYYISISISLVNLVYTMTIYEMEKHENNVHKITQHKELWKDTELMKRDTNINILKKNLVLNSYYILNVILFRFTEVFSRAGLLACLGNTYGGHCLLLALLFDFVLVNILNLVKHLNRMYYENIKVTGNNFKERIDVINYYKYRIQEYDSANYLILRTISAYKIQLAWRQKKNKFPSHVENKNNFDKNLIYTQDGLLKRQDNFETLENIMIENISLRNKFQEKLNHYYIVKKNKFSFIIIGLPAITYSLKSIGVYSNFFMKDVWNKEYFSANLEMNEQLNFPNENYWWNRFKMHFISRYICNSIISGILLHYLICNGIHDLSFPFKTVSIGSIVCFAMNIPSLLRINYCIKNYTKVHDVFLPIQICHQNIKNENESTENEIFENEIIENEIIELFVD